MSQAGRLFQIPELVLFTASLGVYSVSCSLDILKDLCTVNKNIRNSTQEAILRVEQFQVILQKAGKMLSVLRDHLLVFLS